MSPERITEPFVESDTVANNPMLFMGYETSVDSYQELVQRPTGVVILGIESSTPPEILSGRANAGAKLYNSDTAENIRFLLFTGGTKRGNLTEAEALHNLFRSFSHRPLEGVDCVLDSNASSTYSNFEQLISILSTNPDVEQLVLIGGKYRPSSYRALLNCSYVLHENGARSEIAAIAGLHNPPASKMLLNEGVFGGIKSMQHFEQALYIATILLGPRFIHRFTKNRIRG